MSSELKVIDFWAPWCGPCKKVVPIVEELIEEYKGKNVDIEKINIDDNENKEIVKEFNIRSVPAILFIKDDKVINTIIGTTTKDKIKDIIDSNM